mmetsp:Transcript_27800/g.55665  ORF Transcript_27800/g.55665 Transcript_27800/m.55665 type:complete len:256 (+) Transcript_27800:429-1196(+)
MKVLLVLVGRVITTVVSPVLLSLIRPVTTLRRRPVALLRIHQRNRAEPQLRRRFGRGLQPGCCARHGTSGGVVYDPAGENRGDFQFTKEPDPRFPLLSVRVALGVPYTLGLLQNNVCAGRVKGKNHVVSLGMWSILVNGRNGELELGKSKSRPSNTRYAVPEPRAGPVLEGHWTLVQIRRLRVGISKHSHVPHRRNETRILRKIEQRVPDGGLRRVHVEHHESASLAFHVFLKLHPPARFEHTALFRVEVREAEG